ncbi:hypothetical protein [Apilactobacillus micheneri]|uniref:hypothetical protein n=1 Tax=Apilactobacillus micheneri TaxID=1899430 RepID=UPI00112B5A10|nr:hypothetical protein [Apilactobacillus micheneri]TPR40421.1 hypothetical protein DY119_01655 [Apilactobacillus micheneri]
MNLYSINAEYRHNVLNVSVPFKIELPDKEPIKSSIVNSVLNDIAAAIKPHSFLNSYISGVLYLLKKESEIKIENNELTLKYYDHDGVFKINGGSWYMKGY